MEQAQLCNYQMKNRDNDAPQTEQEYPGKLPEVLEQKTVCYTHRGAATLLPVSLMPVSKHGCLEMLMFNLVLAAVVGLGQEPPGMQRSKKQNLHLQSASRIIEDDEAQLKEKEEHYITHNVCSRATESQKTTSVTEAIYGLWLNIELVSWVEEKEQFSSHISHHLHNVGIRQNSLLCFFPVLNCSDLIYIPYIDTHIYINSKIFSICNL